MSIQQIPKKIMVLAGGSDQIALIREINKRFPKAETLLIDYYDEPLAKNFATRHIKESTLNLESVLRIAEDEKIDLVITACTDQALLTMAYVSEKLYLPCYLTYEQAKNLTNKLYMKKLMFSSGIPTSNYQIYDESDLVNVDSLSYPLVVKPVDNNSSNGISKVDTSKDLTNAVKYARNCSRCKKIIVEEFKKGTEYSVDAYLINDEPKLVLVTKTCKHKENNNKFTITQSRYPCQLSDKIIGQIIKIIKMIGETFELHTTPLLIQIICDEDKVNVIEFSARTGGGSKYYLIEKLTGENVLSHLLDITYGDAPEITLSPSKKYAAMVYSYCYPGVFSGVQNLNVLQSQGIISKEFFYKSFGTEISCAQSSSDRPFGYFCEAESEIELINKLLAVKSTLKIIDEYGNNIFKF